MAYQAGRCATKLNFQLTEVTNIIPEKNTIETTIGNLEYDHLVIATGSKTNFFGNQNIEKYAMERTICFQHW